VTVYIDWICVVDALAKTTLPGNDPQMSLSWPVSVKLSA